MTGGALWQVAEIDGATTTVQVLGTPEGPLVAHGVTAPQPVPPP